MIDWSIVRNHLLQGKPLLVFDSMERESEVDMVFYAEKIDASKISFLRRNAGGLICFATGSLVREALGINYIQDMLINNPSIKELVSKKPRYGDQPAFSIWVNHINTYTGITDRDRALTLRNLYEVVSLVYKGYFREARDKFMKEFYAPGHVPILISRGLNNRRGHTELVTALALISGLTPAMVISEMLGEDSSLPYEDAKKFAQKNNLLFLEGVDIVFEAEKRGFLND
ncbi:MAG: 3,4-dihydroxy-2-butanone-4-phosphate synthase [Desulfurococcaceae archaeon]